MGYRVRTKEAGYTIQKWKLLRIPAVIAIVLTFVFASNINSVFSQTDSLEPAPLVPFAGYSSSEDGYSLFTSSNPLSAPLTQGDYRQIYIEARQLRNNGVRFRLCELQLQTDQADMTCPEDLSLEKYYEDFNSQSLQNRFCHDSQVDEQGYCSGEDDIRNQLLRARKLFTQMYLVEPHNMEIQVDNEVFTVKDAGLNGLLETTRELAFVHMIFASEYAIDAFDYRFTIEGLAGNATCEAALERYQQNLETSDGDYDYFADAECVLRNEIALLEASRRQYDLAIDVMLNAYHDDLAWPKEVVIGELFTQMEIQVFSVAVENYASIVDEIAIRHRQLDDDETAATLYSETYHDLFLIALPLLQGAGNLYEAVDQDAQTLLDSNGLAVRAGLDLLKGRLQEIENGINVFGFTQDYVPVQSYFHMRDASDDLFAWAKAANDEAIGATREFDFNSTSLNQEMANVRNSYQRQLMDLCGDAEEVPDNDPNNNFEECIGSEGSLMEQSWLKLASATIHMNLAQQRIESAIETIEDVQRQTDQTIEVLSQTEETVAAVTLAQGMARAYQVTNSTSSSVADEVFNQETTTTQQVLQPGLLSEHYGIGTADETVTQISGLAELAGLIGGAFFGGSKGALAGAQVGGVAQRAFNSIFGSTERSISESETAGIRHSETTMTSVNSIFNRSEIKVAKLENVKAMALLVQELEILGIERHFEIKNQLRIISELQIEKEQAVNQYNQAVSEHNGLVKQWLYLKAEYSRARADLNANYLANPAYRLLKDHKTEVATYQLVYAAKQAYLTAKALEYHIADEVPFINDVFKVRHTSHLQAYLQKLGQLYALAPSVNEDDVEFSLREWASGITDKDISDEPDKTRPELNHLRQQRFIGYMQQHIISDTNGIPVKLVLVFDTSLENSPLNENQSPGMQSRYHWRIAGAVTGATDPSVDRCPVRRPYGVTVKIDAPQEYIPNGMTVVLKMTGHTSTRKENGEIVQYYPQLATLLPREDIPISIRRTLTDAVADASITVNNENNTISDFCNMSVAAASWIMEIPLAENQVDYEKFDDIRLKMSTFYYD